MLDPKAKPEVGSHEYFMQMPADQARREFEITYQNYRAMEKRYYSLRSALAGFKQLLDEVSE